MSRVAPIPALTGGADRPDAALGVFETLLVRAGSPVDARAHLARLERSVSALYRQELPDDLHARLAAIAAAAPLQRVRVIATPAPAAPGASRAAPARFAHVDIDAEPLAAEPAPDPVTLSPAVLPAASARTSGATAACSTSSPLRLDAVPLLARPRRRRARGGIRERLHRRGHPPHHATARRPPAAGNRARTRAGAASRARGAPVARASGRRRRAAARPHPCGASTRHGSPMAQSRTSSSARACVRRSARTAGERSPDDRGRLLRPRARGRRGQRRRRAPRAPGAGPARLHRRRRPRHLADAPARPARGGPARPGRAARVRVLSPGRHAAHHEREVRGGGEVAAHGSAQRRARLEPLRHPGQAHGQRRDRRARRLRGALGPARRWRRRADGARGRPLGPVGRRGGGSGCASGSDRPGGSRRSARRASGWCASPPSLTTGATPAAAGSAP